MKSSSLVNLSNFGRNDICKVTFGWWDHFASIFGLLDHLNYMIESSKEALLYTLVPYLEEYICIVNQIIKRTNMHVFGVYI